MMPYFSGMRLTACLFAFALSIAPTLALAEGSRSLYPASYDTAGARANLDLQDTQRYLDRIVRRGFTYVYAEAGEYIVLGSSNRADNGDILVYNPQDFGIPGDETIPASEDFSCANGSSESGTHFSGSGLGVIGSRTTELAGPNSADNSATVSNGFSPCAYQAPVSGVYGVIFQAASVGGGPNGNIGNVNRSRSTVAAWDISVRSNASSLVDINGRAFTYAFLGFTGGNNRPVFSTLYYITGDGYRYQQDLRGMDPNGYALFANTFGFLDNGEPLYKTLRGSSFSLANLPAGVTTQTSEFPIFFSDVSPTGVNATEVDTVLAALGIPLVPPSPQISNVTFSGVLGGVVTSTGVGGTFSFDTTDTVSYEIVISRDGVNFDGANPLNRMLSGIAFSGVHQVTWDGMDNNNQPFPASPTPYNYRAMGRNGEVHFPMIDVENNGNPSNPAIPGGGPTITRLNGTAPGDTAVFFDDRGYVTLSGEAVGHLNGTLCDNPLPAASSPSVDLDGVDSSTSYRLWQFGQNRNSDCAADAGWGDAKAVNLWTYFRTAERSSNLEIQESVTDVATTVSVLANAQPGDIVQGIFSFANFGSSSASNVSYGMTLSSGLGSVNYTNLPLGATAVYDDLSGVVTLAGFPASLNPLQQLSGMGFSYTAPASGPIDVSTTIATNSNDTVPDNNTAQAVTSIGAVEVATFITGLPAQASGGDTVEGFIEFSNLGGSDAFGVSYSATLGAPGTAPAVATLTGLPSGASYVYDNSTGVITFGGMPTTLVSARIISLSVSYTAPALQTLTIELSSGIATTSTDGIATNNNSLANTDVSYVDLSTEISGLPALATGGDTVQATIDFSNVGSQDAQSVSYSVTVGTPGSAPTTVTTSTLPPGASSSYDTNTGILTLSGMPTSLAAGDTISIGVSYVAPLIDGLSFDVTSNITTSSSDVIPANNPDLASTLISIAPPPAAPAPQAANPVPTLPLPLLFMLVVAVLASASSRMKSLNAVK